MWARKDAWTLLWPWHVDRAHSKCGQPPLPEIWKRQPGEQRSHGTKRSVKR